MIFFVWSITVSIIVKEKKTMQIAELVRYGIIYTWICAVCLQVQSLHVLFEHATGYALFRVKEFEEIGLLQAQVEESVVDVTRFSSVIRLVAFTAFRSGPNALDNINSISEGFLIFSARCIIYISRLCYDVSLRLSVKEVHWHIIANLGFKFQSQFTTHCGRGGGIISPLVILTNCFQVKIIKWYNK